MHLLVSTFYGQIFTERAKYTKVYGNGGHSKMWLRRVPWEFPFVQNSPFFPLAAKIFLHLCVRNSDILELRLWWIHDCIQQYFLDHNLLYSCYQLLTLYYYKQIDFLLFIDLEMKVKSLPIMLDVSRGDKRESNASVVAHGWIYLSHDVANA